MTALRLNKWEEEIVLELANAAVNAVPQVLAPFMEEVQAQPPEVQLISLDALSGVVGKGLLGRITFKQGLTGQQYIYIPADSAITLASLMLGKDPPLEPAGELSVMEKSALEEVVGMMMGTYCTTLSGFLNCPIGMEAMQMEYVAPAAWDFNEDDAHNVSSWVVVRSTLKIKQAFVIEFRQYIPYALMQDMVAPLLPSSLDADTPGQSGKAAETFHARNEQEALFTEDDYLPQQKTGYLNMMQQDALAEVGNISLGASATALSKIINRKVQITTPAVSLTTMGEVRANYPTPCLVVTVNYSKGLAGHNILILKEDDALTIVGVMMGLEPPERPPELGEMEISGISEAMNQMMGSASTAMSDLFHCAIDISPPHVELKDLKVEEFTVDEMNDQNQVVQLAFRMEVGELLDTILLQLLPLDFAREISNQLLAGVGMAEPANENMAAAEETSMFSFMDMFNGDLADTAPDKEADRDEADGDKVQKVWQEADFARIDMIRDIPVNIHVLLGKTRLPLKKLFSIFPGEVITMDRYLGEPLDVFANDRLVAKGEVVLVNGQFGFKIIDLLRP